MGAPVLGFFAVAALAGGVAAWARDLVGSLRDLSRGHPAEAMAQVDRVLAIADVVVLAAIADGEIDPRELERLEVLAIEDGPIRARAADAISNWQTWLRGRVEVPAVISMVGSIGARLDPDERRLALSLIAQLEPARPRRLVGDGGYRSAMHEELDVLDAFGEALGVPASEVSALRTPPSA